MSKIVLLGALLVSFHTTIVYGQDKVVIKGRVFDAESMELLSGATVLFDRDKGTVTDQNGFFAITLPPGVYTLTFRFIGYSNRTKVVDATMGNLHELNIGMNAAITQIDHIVVSAGRVQQRIGESTISLTLLEPRIFTEHHISDVKEAINKLSGIEIMDGQASIRGGSGFSYGAGSRVLALVDGIPVLGADAGNIRWQFLPMENISQVEIIKGASSVLYGSSALNGIINFRTADATPTGRTTFHLEGGLFDQPQNENWVWWESPRSFYSGSFSHLKKYGNTQVGIGSFLLIDQGYRRLNDEFLARANLRLVHQHKTIEGLSYGFLLNGGYTEKTDFVLWENATTGALKQNEESANELNSGFVTIDPFISYRQGEQASHELRGRIQSSINRFPEGMMTNSDAISVFAEYQGWMSITEILNLTGGLVQNTSVINSLFYGNHNAFNAAAYLQADLNPIDRLTVVAGVRFEHNVLNGLADRIVPLMRGGINYRIEDMTFFRASWGQGFRYPSIAEKFAATTLGAVRIFPSPGLLPEFGWNAEVGIKHGILTGSLNGILDLALFYTRNRDMIEFAFGNYTNPVTNESGLGFRAENIEYSSVYGLEVEFKMTQTAGRFTNTLAGGYLFSYPREINPLTNQITGEYLKFRRKHSANINLSTRIDPISIGIGLFFNSPILRIDDVFLNEATREAILPGFYDYWMAENNSYITGDLFLAYTLSRNYTLSLAIKNFTNTQYMGRPGDIQPQRNFSLRLSGQF